MAQVKSKAKTKVKAKGTGRRPEPQGRTAAKAARSDMVAKGKSKVKGAKSAVEIRREKELARLKAWKEKARKDPAYRKREAEKECERKAELRRDAEFGRACRMFFEGLKQMLELINEKGKNK